MPEEIRVWRIEGDSRLREVRRSRLDLEERLEDWLANDISVLDPNLLVIGRQVETAFGGFIDLLCLNRDDASFSTRTLDLLSGCGGADYEGFQGFFANDAEIDRFVAVVEQGQLHEKS